eukprot:5005680-Pleurochrysis_carterae.AAC.2
MMRLPGAPAPGDCPLHPTAANHRLRPFPTPPALALLTAICGEGGLHSIYCTIAHSRGQALSHCERFTSIH